MTFEADSHDTHKISEGGFETMTIKSNEITSNQWQKLWTCVQILDERQTSYEMLLTMKEGWDGMIRLINVKRQLIFSTIFNFFLMTESNMGEKAR